MDEYGKEIRDLESQIEAMVLAEDDPKAISELAMQVEVLRAMYRRAVDLYQRGESSQDLRLGLKLQGYGEWALENVYAFVYETCVDLPADGHHAFLHEIATIDLEEHLTGES